MTSRSDLVIPGPPLRGIFSPAATSMTYIVRSESSGEKVAARVVAAGFDEDQLDAGKRPLQPVDGFEVDRGILANRRVRAAAGFDADDALRRQRRMVHQESGVLGGVDVVGDDGHVDLFAQRLAQGQRQGGLAGTDGAADTDAQGLFAHGFTI